VVVSGGVLVVEGSWLEVGWLVASGDVDGVSGLEGGWEVAEGGTEVGGGEVDGGSDVVGLGS